MSRRTVIVAVSLLALIGASAVYSPRWRSDWRHDTSHTTDHADAKVWKSMPVVNLDVLQATGVYAWRWKLATPSEGEGPKYVVLGYTTKGEAKQLASLQMPSGTSVGRELDVLLVMHFDNPAPSNAQRLNCSLTIGGMTTRLYHDNPFKGYNTSALTHQPEGKGRRVLLMTFDKIAERNPIEVELAVEDRRD